ncbi:MAG: hypothetical protein AB1782_10340 [Cyanobacteriota bacterium]
MSNKMSPYLIISIFVTVIFMTIFAISTEVNLISKARTDKIGLYETISNTIVIANQESIVNDNFFYFERLINLLKENGIIVYTFVINGNGTIKYSSNPAITNKSQDSNEFKQVINNLESLNIQETDPINKIVNLILFRKLTDPLYRNAIKLPRDYTVLVYFYVGSISNISSIYLLNFILAITFIVSGFLSAVVLANKFSQVE